MKFYKLSYVLYDPSNGSTEPDKYMAEIPAIPGCRAWGDTPEETLVFIQDIAAQMIEINEEEGWELPDEVKDALVKPALNSDIMVAV